MRFIALDLETTGLNPESDAIIEVAAIRFEDGVKVDELQTLINPGREIPEVTTRITGITDEMVVGAPAFEDIKDDLIEFIGNDPILGQNIQFDTGFLNANGLDLTNPELDTFTLARSIIPKAPSYSLEVLAELLNLPHESAHRAYDDALASVHLMEALIHKLVSYNDTVTSQIASLLESQDWTWKEVLLTSIGNKESILKNYTPHEAKEAEKSEGENEESSKMQINISGKKVTEGYLDIDRYDFTEQTLVVLPPYRMHKYKTETYVFPQSILVPEKLEKLLSENRTWDEEETTCIIKLIIWFSETETYETQELRLYNKEYQIAHLISLDHGESHPIYDKKLEYLRGQNKVMISHANLLRSIIKGNEIQLDCKNLLLLDAINFEKIISRYLTVTLRVNDFDERGTMLFAMLGILCEKYCQSEQLLVDMDIDEEVMATPEWSKCKSLIDELTTNPDSTALKLLKKITTESDDANAFNLSIFRNDQEDILLRAHPANPLGILKEHLWDQFENIIINDDIAHDGEAEFVADALQLQGFETKYLQSHKPLNILRLPKPNDDAFIREASKHILDIIPNYENTLMVFPTNSKISTFMERLGPELGENHTLLGQGFSGSNGKLIMNISDEGKNVILCNADFALELTEILKEKGLASLALVFMRAPFMHPKNWYLRYMSTFYKDTFRSYSLPKARLTIMKLIERYSNMFEGTEHYVADGRIR